MNNLSIVIPVFNEQDNIFKLAEEIKSAFRWASFEWEVIWVDDCSTDETKSNLEFCCHQYPNHTMVIMHERGGQSAAVLYGIAHTQYELIATLDGDGQNSPYDLVELKKLLEETDMYLAQGVRLTRQDPGIRLFSTGIANGFRRKVLGDTLCDVGCAVRVFRKDILNGLPAFKGWHRFLPVMISFLYPDKVIEHPVLHRQRISGQSKYGVMNRLWVGLFDLVGMYWFKRRTINLWKSSSMSSALPANAFLAEEYSSSGLQAKELMNQ